MDTTIDFQSLPTPSYVVDETLLRRNLEILKSVKDQTGCKILLAQKAFSMYHFYPLIAEYLDGTTASSVHEAQLGFEEFGKETHVFAPAFKKEEMEALLPIVDHIVFNSPNQVKLYAEMVKNSQRPIEIGLRVNPELSTQDHALYDPASPFSRLGTTAVNFDESQVELLDGLHFHTLCEQGSDALEATLVAFEEKFGKYLHG
ncbi:MAG: carboxynorspermidine decarboxylase, partial [Trichococcus flocculiformis]